MLLIGLIVLAEEAFWSVNEDARLDRVSYPINHNVFLVCGNWVVAIDEAPLKRAVSVC